MTETTPPGTISNTLEPAEHTVVKLQPVPVSVKEIDNAAARATASDAEASLKALGQREINLIWEHTQMKIALSVVGASLTVSLLLGVFGKWLGNPDLQLASLVFIYGVANLVTGFYFGRTNHTKTGGVGSRAADSR